MGLSVAVCELAQIGTVTVVEDKCSNSRRKEGDFASKCFEQAGAVR